MYTGNNTLPKEIVEVVVSPRGGGKTQARIARMSRVMAAIKTLPGTILKSKHILTAEDMRMVTPPVEVLLYRIPIPTHSATSIPKLVMNSVFGTALTEEELRGRVNLAKEDYYG